MTQRNLGGAYGSLLSGDLAANQRNSLGYYQAALRVYTEQTYPQEWSMTQESVGVALLKQGDREAATEALQLAARGYRSCNDKRSAERVEGWLHDNTA
jgi:hypothetical protein